MSKPLPNVPRTDDTRFQDFCDFLRKTKVLPAKGLATSSYVDHLSVLVVPVDPQPNCDISYCWFNCIDHQLSNGGQVVYGWSLWQRGDVFIAQHHAIWRNEEGELLDPTPNEGLSAQALFMPDNRAPFDVERLRTPPNLEWKSNGDFKWVAGNHHESFFFIGAMEPTEAQSGRIKRIHQRLGLI